MNQALTFDTTDSHIEGGCDLFTTKPVGADRKLYKRIDKNLNHLMEENALNHEHELQYPNGFPMSISPPTYYNSRRYSTSNVGTNTARKQPVTSRSVSHTPYISPESFSEGKGSEKGFEKGFEKYDDESPFGPLSQQTSRRNFAYLIGILNSTYPDHDFSSLQPDNFTLMKSCADLTHKFNSILTSLNYTKDLNWIWQTINSHIQLDDSSVQVYSYEPEESFISDEPGTLWSLMWFILNKKRKRVVFLHLKATMFNNNNRMARRESNVRTLDEMNRSRSFDEEYDLTYPDEEAMDYDEDVVGDLEMD